MGKEGGGEKRKERAAGLPKMYLGLMPTLYISKLSDPALERERREKKREGGKKQPYLSHIFSGQEREGRASGKRREGGGRGEGGGVSSFPPAGKVLPMTGKIRKPLSESFPPPLLKEGVKK